MENKSIQEVFDRLNEYILDDPIYKSYKDGTLKEPSEYDWVCIKHCEDIRFLLEAYLNLEEENEWLRTEPDYDGYIADRIYEEKKLKEF